MARTELTRIRIRSELPKTIRKLKVYERELNRVLYGGRAGEGLAFKLAEALKDEIVRRAAPWPGAHERVLRTTALREAWDYIQTRRQRGTVVELAVGNWYRLGTGEVASRARPPRNPIRRFLKWLKIANPRLYGQEMAWYRARTGGGMKARGLFIKRLREDRPPELTRTLARRMVRGWDPQLAYHFLLRKSRDAYLEWRRTQAWDLGGGNARWWWLFETGKPTTGFPSSQYLRLALQSYRARRRQFIVEAAARLGGRPTAEGVELSLAEAVKRLRRAGLSDMEADPLARYGLK